MKQNFGQKFYDVLLGEGPGGGNLYTTILSTAQKSQLAMMQSTAEVHKALSQIRRNAPSNVRYVQEMSDIKQFINKRGLFWANMMMFSCCIAFGTLITLNSVEKDTIGLITCFALLVLGCVGIIVSNAKATKYKKQKLIMQHL